MAAIIMRRK